MIDTTLLNKHFDVVTDAVGALIFPVKSNKFPPTVNLVQSFSYFSGSNLHTIFPYVTFLSFGNFFWNGNNCIHSFNRSDTLG